MVMRYLLFIVHNAFLTFFVAYVLLFKCIEWCIAHKLEYTQWSQYTSGIWELHITRVVYCFCMVTVTMELLQGRHYS